MKKYLYILSQRYSGSTLLTFLLSTHPEISTIGERRKFYNKVIRSSEFQHHKAKHCSCGALFADCAYLNEIKDDVLSKVSAKWLRKNATELKLFDNKYVNKLAYETHKAFIPFGFSPFSSIVNGQQKVNEALVNTILNKEGTSVFLDSSKVINHALYLSQIKSFDFKVVWLVRDPRAQIASAIKYHKWPVEKATALWLKEMKENQKILHGFKIPYTKLNYSDLCAKPSAEIKRILGFIDVNPDDFSLLFRDQEHHIMGNHMRLQKDQKIVERKDWKEKLSSSQIQYINERTQNFKEYHAD